MIYLDNAAATPVEPALMDFYREQTTRYFANQESGHALAYEARKALEKAAVEVTEIITGGQEAYVYWGSSATALFNLVGGFFDKGKIAATPDEHPALSAVMQRTGLPIHYGIPDETTTLAVIGHVQSETGFIRDLVKAREAAPQAVLWCDTVQSAGKLAIPWREAKIDIAFCSSHKIGAPGGALLICRSRQLYEYLTALRKEQYLDGRMEPALCLTLAEALKRAWNNIDKHCQRAEALRDKIIDAWADRQLPNGQRLIVTVEPRSSSPFILHLTVSGYQAAVLVRMLSAHGIYVSSGSACQAETNEPSKAMLALGFSRQEAYSGMRLSFWNNQIGDAEKFIKGFEEVIKEY